MTKYNQPLKLKHLLKKHQSLLMPVAHDALTAKLIETVGFQAISIGGFGVAASAFALPDNGSLTIKQLLPPFTHILQATTLPALVDADTGYGGPAQVAKTISAYEQAGAAAIFIEDQTWPKRCGHTNGHQLIPAVTMQAKIRAAVAAKTNLHLIIMARTDAISAEGSLDAAITRAKAYLEAGADAIFVEAPTTKQQLKAIPQLLPKTLLLANMMEGGKTPLCSQKELQNWGYHMIAYPILTLLSSTQASLNALKHLKEHGQTRELLNPHLMPFVQFKHLIGL